MLRNTPERLKQRLQFFGKLLGCSHQWVLNMVRRYPNLINVKSGRVLRHFEDLKVTFKGRFSESGGWARLAGASSSCLLAPAGAAD